MDKVVSQPQVINDVQNYSVIQQKPFCIDISALFKPNDGSLNFYINGEQLPWLQLEQHRGLLHGVAPKIAHNTHFKFTIKASNESGYITKDLILIVLVADVVEDIVQPLELILNKRKEYYSQHHLHPYTPSLLEYVYQFFQQAEYDKDFRKSVRQAALEQDMKVSKKVTFKEFENVIKKINPDLEQQLKTTLAQDDILTMAELNNKQLQNLFQEGAQIPGSITIPVWNHCAYPALYNWPEWQVFSNVIHAASHQVRRLHEQTHNIMPVTAPNLKSSH